MNKLLVLSLLILLSFNLHGQTSEVTDSTFLKYIQNNDSLNAIEGIWRIEITQEYYHFDTLYDVSISEIINPVVIIKKDNSYQAFYLKGDSFNVEFLPTDVKGVYLYRNYFPLTSDYSDKQAVISTHGEMQYTYDLPVEYAKQKFAGKYVANTRIVNVLKWKKVFPLQ